MKTYQYLNLEQKMVKIRKKMPSLLKKFHNDEADYDFATLDDIYECMTPALNKYGVDFDIVEEKPTQYENEKPVYLTHDEDGYWRYEADLKIRWANIDNPKEERYAVIHILGTHEIPDKARGTAMTYSLKYYFRNKFCMRQIDSVNDDPDGMEYNTEKDCTEPEKDSSKPEKGGKTESRKIDVQKPDGKENKKAVESKETKVSGNRCSRGGEIRKAEKDGKNIPPENKNGMAAEEPIGSRGEAKDSNGSKSPAGTKPQGEKKQQKSAETSDHSNGKDGSEQFEQVEFVVEESAGAPPVEQKTAKGQQTRVGQKDTVVQQTIKPKAAAVQQTDSPKETAGQKMMDQKTEEQQIPGQMEIDQQQVAVSRQPEDIGDGFQAAGEEKVPFEEDRFMEELEQEMEKETKNLKIGLEEAKNYVCTFGLYKGKKLADVFNSGVKGQEIVKWIAYRYQGPERDMIDAAKLVAENPDAVLEQAVEQQAA